MSIQKPWAEPYSRLLSELIQRWGGEIKELDKSDHGGARRIPNSLFHYPRYHAEVEQHRLLVENSEMPFAGKGFIGAGNNNEYLRVAIMAETDMNVAIRREGFFDRLKKTLRVDWEYQTGDEQFDRQYFLLADHEGHPERLRDPGMRRAITEMEPFDGLQIGGGIIMWSQGIESEEQLQIAKVESVVERLFALSKLVCAGAR